MISVNYSSISWSAVLECCRWLWQRWWSSDADDYCPVDGDPEMKCVRARAGGLVPLPVVSGIAGAGDSVVGKDGRLEPELHSRAKPPEIASVERILPP